MCPALVSRHRFPAVPISYTVNETSSRCAVVTKASSFVLLKLFAKHAKHPPAILYNFARLDGDVRQVPCSHQSLSANRTFRARTRGL